MKKILVPLADGFEEIETATIVDVLRRAGLDVLIAGIKPGAITGAHEMRLLPDTTMAEVRGLEFDLVVLPGGQPGVDNLRGNADVLEMLKQMNQKKKMIAAICAAPLALQDAGLIKGKRLTSYPGVEAQLEGAASDSAAVVVDGRLVTSRGPGTAMAFALKIVELLCNQGDAKKLSQSLLAG